MSEPVNKRPIGVFDSGLGGLTVLKAVMARLPHEDTIYFGDSGRAPYGSKSADTVTKFSLQNARFLLEQQVKMIIIACNTASSRAFDAVSQSAGLPVIEVIGPGARAAAQATRNRRIGVIGTRGTVESQVYPAAIRRCLDGPADIYQQACPLFVSLAEEGWWDRPVTYDIARIYLEPLLERGIDTLVLGCTHYPLLSGVIAATAGPDVRLVNAGAPIADIVAQTLERTGLINDSRLPGKHVYFTSDSVEQFKTLGSAFLDEPVEQAYRIDIERY
ncbi:MAG: glutamate racemase [Eubacteriales bacterium]|nr:glutamate racemase [Eubacteriales bacterium]